MNAPAIDHALSGEISNIRDFTTRLARGEFDSCDQALLKRLVDLAGWLKDAAEITVKATT